MGGDSCSQQRTPESARPSRRGADEEEATPGRPAYGPRQDGTLIPGCQPPGR